jgi:hypothetical protein
MSALECTRLTALATCKVVATTYAVLLSKCSTSIGRVLAMYIVVGRSCFLCIAIVMVVHAGKEPNRAPAELPKERLESRRTSMKDGVSARKEGKSRGTGNAQPG